MEQAGHALVGALMPEYDPVQKISIVPRGQAGGLTFFAPSEERLESGLYSKSYLENQVPTHCYQNFLIPMYHSPLMHDSHSYVVLMGSGLCLKTLILFCFIGQLVYVGRHYLY